MNNIDSLGGPPQRPDFDPYSHPASGGPSSAGRWIQYALLLVGVALVIRVGWGVWKWGEEGGRNGKQAGDDSFAARKEDSSVVAETKERPPLQRGTSAMPVDDRARADWSAGRRRELMHLTAEVRRQLSAWREEARLWQTEVAALMENDAGKRLTRTPDWIRAFRAIYQLPRPDEQRAVAIDDITAELTRRENETADGELYTPEQAALDRIKALATEAAEAAESYREARRQLQALLEDAEAKNVLGDKPLREALAEFERLERVDEVVALEKRLEAARVEVQAKIAAAREEAIRQLGEAEAARILAAVAEAKAKLENDAAADKQGTNSGP